MPQFKRVFSQLLRLHPKFRQQPRQRSAAAPTANTAVMYRDPSSLRQLAHLDPESKVQNAQPSTDTLVEEVEEFDDDDEGECSVE